MSHNWKVFQTIGEWRVYHPDVTVDVPTVFPCTGLVDTDGYSHVFDVEDAQRLLDARPRPEIVWRDVSGIKQVADVHHDWKLEIYDSGYWDINNGEYGSGSMTGYAGTLEAAKARATKLWWAIVDAGIPLP